MKTSRTSSRALNAMGAWLWGSLATSLCMFVYFVIIAGELWMVFPVWPFIILMLLGTAMVLMILPVTAIAAIRARVHPQSVRGFKSLLLTGMLIVTCCGLGFGIGLTVVVLAHAEGDNVYRALLLGTLIASLVAGIIIARFEEVER